MGHLRKRGFTLIELMTVILVIGILVGLLFPALYGVREQARRRQAKAAKTAIETGVRNYHYEYGKWPIPAGDLGAAGNTTYADNNYQVVNILTSAVPPKLDIADYKTDGRGTVLDPWREPYRIVIDTDYNDDVRGRDYPGGDGGVCVVPTSNWK
jgi:prepilin-type N-terminal cleavage/methylation domain-containing protein